MLTGITRAGIILSLALLVGAAIGSVGRTAYAEAGDLDTSFGGDGKVVTQFLDGDEQINSLVIQADGKIVSAGYTIISQTTLRDFALARYLPNGDLDTSFNGDGKVITHVLGDVDIIYGLALQPDGKIVAVGTAREISTANLFFAAARYLPNGALDGTFGGGTGKVTISFNSFDARAEAVAIQADGKIVLGGYKFDGSTDDDFAMVRLNPDGTLDTTFSGDGKLTYDFFGGQDQIRGLELQADGRIVVAGNAYISGGNYDFAVARFNPDGSFDTTFDGDGKALTDFFGGDDGAYDLAIQTNGAIVVAGGVYYEPSSYNFGVARYLANGSLDPNFGVGGIKAEDIGGVDTAFGVAIQYDGKIVLAGDATAGTEDFAVARFNPDGFLDTTFSGDGFLTTDISGADDLAAAVAIQPNGRIVTAGRSYRSQFNYDFALTRYLSGLEPPPSSTPTDTPLPTQTPGGPTATPQGTSTSAPSATPQGTPTTCTLTFTDVPPGSTFYPYIRCLACRGIVNGYSDGSFKPNNPVTRGQLSKIVANSAGFSDPQPAQMFEDVPLGSTFQVYIGRLASRGYINGYPCGGAGEPCIPPGNLPYFRPNNNATRGQIAKIVSNSAGFSEPPVGQTFEDVAPGSVFYTFTQRLTLRSIMSGYPCGGAGEPCIPPDNRPYFRPNNNATRGQTSKIVSGTFFPNCQTPR